MSSRNAFSRVGRKTPRTRPLLARLVRTECGEFYFHVVSDRDGHFAAVLVRLRGQLFEVLVRGLLAEARREGSLEPVGARTLDEVFLDLVEPIRRLGDETHGELACGVEREREREGLSLFSLEEERLVKLSLSLSLEEERERESRLSPNALPILHSRDGFQRSRKKRRLRDLDRASWGRGARASRRS